MNADYILFSFTGIIVASIMALICKIIFDWLKQPRDENGKVIKCPLDRSGAIGDIKWLKEFHKADRVGYTEAIRDITWLREVHDKTDQDGIPLWYVPRSAVMAISKIAEESTKQSQSLSNIASLLSSNGERLDTLIKNGNK